MVLTRYWVVRILYNMYNVDEYCEILKGVYYFTILAMTASRTSCTELYKIVQSSLNCTILYYSDLRAETTIYEQIFIIITTPRRRAASYCLAAPESSSMATPASKLVPWPLAIDKATPNSVQSLQRKIVWVFVLAFGPLFWLCSNLQWSLDIFLNLRSLICKCSAVCSHDVIMDHQFASLQDMLLILRSANRVSS
jgi:hypothetical protein